MIHSPLPMTVQKRSTLSNQRRLQFVLLLMIAWEALLLVSELSFGSALFDVDVDQISGVLGARGSLSGAAVIPIALYGFAFTRGPLKHPSILLVAALEQVAAIVFGAYHLFVSDLEAGSYVVPLAVSLTFLTLIVINLPRGDAE
jgi:hypothetical protein